MNARDRLEARSKREYDWASHPDVLAVIADLDAATTERDNARRVATMYQRQIKEMTPRDLDAATAARDAILNDLRAIRTYNGTDVTATNLRYAATHQALNPSWIFDVLTGLAALIERHEGNQP